MVMFVRVVIKWPSRELHDTSTPKSQIHFDLLYRVVGIDAESNLGGLQHRGDIAVLIPH